MGAGGGGGSQSIGLKNLPTYFAVLVLASSGKKCHGSYHFDDTILSTQSQQIGSQPSLVSSIGLASVSILLTA